MKSIHYFCFTGTDCAECRISICSNRLIHAIYKGIILDATLVEETVMQESATGGSTL